MVETKRVPTELEIKQLLRDSAKRMEDDAEIGDFALSGGRVTWLRLLPIVLGGICVFGLLFIEPSMNSWPGMVASLAWVFLLVQAARIQQLERVTKALARAAERTRHTELEPLPRAPSPPD